MQMFDLLSNAMNPNKIPCNETAPSTANSTPAKQQDIDTIPDLLDVKHNLPNFNLDPIDNFDTIDDNLLAELVHGNSLTTTDQQDQNKITKKPTIQENAVVSEVTVPMQSVKQTPAQYNTQVINDNMPMHNFPCIPSMYFPHSNVTINYNFNN